MAGARANPADHLDGARKKGKSVSVAAQYDGGLDNVHLLIITVSVRMPLVSRHRGCTTHRLPTRPIRRYQRALILTFSQSRLQRHLASEIG